MNRNWVVFHLGEARDAIDETLKEIRETPDYDYGEFWVAMQHIYHHLNTAWNARDATEDRMARLSREDFYQWSRFPADLPMMGE